RPLDRIAQALLHFGSQVRPAGESIFACDDELRVAAGERNRRSRQLRVNASNGIAVSGGGALGELLRLLAKRVERRACGEFPCSGHSASFQEPPVPAEESG